MPSKGGLIWPTTSPVYCMHHTMGNFKILKKHEFSHKLQTSVIVSIAVSKIGMTELTFVFPGMKVNSQYYCDDILSQQMLPAIKHVASDKTTRHLIMQGHH